MNSSNLGNKKNNENIKSKLIFNLFMIILSHVLSISKALKSLYMIKKLGALFSTIRIRCELQALMIKTITGSRLFSDDG